MRARLPAGVPHAEAFRPARRATASALAPRAPGLLPRVPVTRAGAVSGTARFTACRSCPLTVAWRLAELKSPRPQAGQLGQLALGEDGDEFVADLQRAHRKCPWPHSGPSQPSDLHKGEQGPLPTTAINLASVPDYAGKRRIVRGLSAGDASADPELREFCGDATAAGSRGHRGREGESRRPAGEPAPASYPWPRLAGRPPGPGHGGPSLTVTTGRSLPHEERAYRRIFVADAQGAMARPLYSDGPVLSSPGWKPPVSRAASTGEVIRHGMTRVRTDSSG
jgi:hypothetical protein